MNKSKNLYNKLFCLTLALISTFSINLRNGLYVGNCPENAVGNILSRLYSAVGSLEIADLFIFFSLCALFNWGFKLTTKVNFSAAFTSAILSLLYVLAIFYRNFNSSLYLRCDAFQLCMAMMQIFGIGTILYFLLLALDWYFSTQLVSVKETPDNNVFHKYFFIISSGFIFLCWLVWLLLTYPGSTNPDAILQLQNFYGDVAWTTWQPPFSSVIMGGLFHIGKLLVDANFGFFLYNLVQGIAGALVFSFALSRLNKKGAPLIVSIAGMIFFGLAPMWGAYVQWFEKDFLYTVSVVLFITLMAEVIIDKNCSRKQLIFICMSGLAMALLRNNGIYVIIPTTLAASIYLKSINRKRIIGGLAIVFLSYELIVKGLYPALGIGETSIAETIGFMFQATARYVQEFPQDVTPYEREVIAQNFQNFDNLLNYNPRIIDPVKIYYNHSDFGSYLKIWLQMLFKHPGVYIESLLNGSYGYLAPVSVDIGAYVMLGEYDPYLKELGIAHVENGNLNSIAVWIWHLGNGLPLIKYFASPGLYTWLTLAALWLLWRHKKTGGIILLIPSLINIAVCIASPLADAMRYALPTVAAFPLIVGWMYVFRMETQNSTIE